MSPTTSPPPLDENELLAAEYALGVLEGGARARAEDLLQQSPSFAARVAAWDMRFAPLADEVPAVTPPKLMPQIEARLFGRRAGRKWLTFPTGWLGGLVGSGVMAALAVVFFALLLQFGSGSVTPIVQTAVLLQKDSDVQFLARLEGGVLTVTRSEGAPPKLGRSYELWIINGDTAPVSLGLIDVALTLPAPSLPIGYVLAVTDEPLGGGPGGKPSGPVVAMGLFSDI